MDHLRSMTMDWPNYGLGWPTPCPMPLAQTRADMSEAQAAAALQQLKWWLETSVLSQPVCDWLAQYSAPEAFLAWCRQNATAAPPARFLLDCHATTHVLKTTYRPLDMLDQDSEKQALELQRVAQAIGNQTGFAQQPNWKGQCAETGAWTRVGRRQATTGICATDQEPPWGSYRSSPPASLLAPIQAGSARMVVAVDCKLGDYLPWHRPWSDKTAASARPRQPRPHKHGAPTRQSRLCHQPVLRRSIPSTTAGRGRADMNTLPT